MVYPDGATLTLGPNRMRVAEAEFAFRMSRDLPPRDEPYSQDEVLDAVAALHLAIEVPDSRYTDFTLVGAPQLIADNACGHQFVLGREAPALWRSLDLATHRVTGRVGTRLEREGIGANVLGDPRTALDHDHFRSGRPKVINVIGILYLARVGRKTGTHFS